MLPVFTLTPSEKKRFAQQLLAWFAANARDLPWRETYEPYAVWISEIMLQQTQMERGVAYFNAWMQRFPTVAHVAAAPEEDILKAWEGLGYYRRARNLHAAAKIIMANHGGDMPRELASIRALPGVGEYTAAAIYSIAFNSPAPAVDANVMRIFSRICDIDVPLTQPGVRQFITGCVETLTPEDSPRQFTQALMELGALVCAKTPRCDACPLADYCEARRLGTAAKRPKKDTKVEYSYLEMSTALIHHNGRFFLQKRPPYGVWAGLWETPGGCLESGETPEQALTREVLEETEFPVIITEKIAEIRHSYTTCRVTMHAYACELDTAALEPSRFHNGEARPVLHAAVEGAWLPPESFARLTFPAGHRKLIERLRKERTYGFLPE